MQGTVVEAKSVESGYVITVVIPKPVSVGTTELEINKSLKEADKIMSSIGLGKIEVRYL